MRRAAVAAMACLALLKISQAQTDTLCLTDDVSMLLQSGILADSGSMPAELDSVTVNGGTCDSVSLTIYASSVPLPVGLTVVKTVPCSLRVGVSLMGTPLVDYMVSYCGAGVKPRAASGRSSGRGNSAQLVSPLRGVESLAGEVRVYNLDGTVVGGPEQARRPAAPGVRILIHSQTR